MGSFFSGIGDSILGGLGGKSAYNQKRSDENLDNYGADLRNSYDQYSNTLGALGNQNTQLANQNFYGNAQNIYGQQQQASQMLYNQATGNAPSMADLQMQQGLGNANNQIQSAAFSQQGGVSPGLTQRNMLNAQAMQNANIVGQGQVARIGEMNSAQNNYANLLGSMQAQQQAQGQLQYGQSQNALNYATQNANNLNNAATTNANNLIGQRQQAVDQAAGAKQQQYQAMANTMAAAATGGATLATDGVKGLAKK